MVGIFILTVSALFFIHTIEIWSWAILYIWIGEFEGISESLYFSMVTFSTLGYGDITLNERWRLLSGFESVSGIILVGVSTALVFAIIQKVYTIFDTENYQFE